MSSKRICSTCLHNLRQGLRAENALQRFTQQYFPKQQNVRALSTRSSLSRQMQDRQHSADAPPPVMPITTSTVTSIPTAETPAPSLHDKSSTTLPSTSQMQRAITSRLSGSADDLTTSLAKTLRRSATKTTETYITYGLTESLFKACSVQADYTIPEEQRKGLLTGEGPAKTAGGEDLGIPVPASADSWWFAKLGLAPTFSTWSQVAYLHMYLLTVRLRALNSPTSFQSYQRYLLEHFSHAAEDKMIIMHNMGARGVRNKYLKDLFLQWRGILAAYDEGMVKGDAVLAGAVWRNLFKGEEDVDWTKVASVVAWMRGLVSVLGRVDMQDLVGNLEGKQGLFEVGLVEAQKLAAKTSLGVTERIV